MSASAPLDADAIARRVEEIRAFGRLLDSSIRLPGGFRIGWDGIIGLVPVVGDAVGVGLSGWLVWRAVELGLPRSTIARMVFNVLLEGLIGTIPVLGDAFDFVFKANNRNVRLIEKALERSLAQARRSQGEGNAGAR